jgi:hypothetical protein
MQSDFKLRTKNTQMLVRECESKENLESARKVEALLCSTVGSSDSSNNSHWRITALTYHHRWKFDEAQVGRFIGVK